MEFLTHYFLSWPVQNGVDNERQEALTPLVMNRIQGRHMLGLSKTAIYMHNDFFQFIKRKQDQTPPLMLP